MMLLNNALGRVKVWAIESQALIPGLLVVSLLTWLSISLGELIGERVLGFEKSPISPVMIAIILGIAISSLVTIPKTFAPGMTFSVKKILRLGIILLGIRLSLFDVLKLGVFGLPIVIACISGALLITRFITNSLNLPKRLGALIAVGTSICGVTAIVATSPAIDASEDESAYSVAVITVFGLFATLFYPYLAHLIFAEHAVKAGLFLGTSVHETAQVVGAAKIYADIYNETLALDVATVAKLVRNVFIIIVIPFMAYSYAYQANGKDGTPGKKTNLLKLLPLFILGFLAMAIFRTIGDATFDAGGSAFGLLAGTTWNQVITTGKSLAETLLVVALAAVGLGTNFRSIRSLGIKPFIVGLGASFSVGLVSFIAITLLGSLITF